MYRESSRVSWQREIYQNHFAPPAKINTKTDLLRVALLLIVLALLASVILPVCLRGEFRCGYLLLVEQQLPGMGARLEKIPFSPDGAGGEAAFSLRDFSTRLLLGSELSGFRAAGTVKEISAKPEENVLPSPEHLLVDFGNKGENPSGSAAEQPPVSLLAGVGTVTSANRSFPPVKEAPRVLIYHTHSSESFLPISGKAFSSDPQHSVIFLGERLAEILEKEYNIPVLHHRENFDIPRSEAYAQACPAITAILEQNPQIEVVVDLHRDGISREVTTTSIEGRNTARILFVVGTRHEGWNSNLRFSLFLQSILDQKYPGLCRGTRKQAFTYNQHVHPRSILVEIGGHENNREEVLRAVPCLAEALAKAFN
ncbi:MAG: stage II sporulation protein P [Bacillota bacterium]